MQETVTTPDAVGAGATQPHLLADIKPEGAVADDLLVEADLVIEGISIDGMCGVY